MKYIYVDNYRGFQDTAIPLRDVNFFVGENSTGKTSILSLLKLITDFQFWYQLKFNTEEIQLGTFQEIISKESLNNDSFKFGFYETGDSDKSSQFAFLAHFVERDGMPDISRIDIFGKNRETTIVNSSKGILYSFEKKVVRRTDSAFMGLLKDWSSRKPSPKKLKKFKEPYALAVQKPWIYIIQMIEAETKNTNFLFHMQDIFNKYTWFAPIRSKPKRTYDEYKTEFVPDGSHVPYLIRKLMEGKGSDKFLDFIRDFGKKSGLLDSISIKKFSKDEAVSPFSLNIKLGKKSLNIQNVGYGVSQCLPLIVELYQGAKEQCYAIQQPEVHLHPKAQAVLGELFFYFCTTDKKKFFIETHSDYAIDRFRRNVRDSKKKVDSQLLFFKRTDSGNVVIPIGVDDNGQYPEDQPKEFREFFLNEQLSNLGILK